ncbi:MAG: DUF1559 domain-containing protein [Planctomyces sp.]|nr:DUF1559 domain-containing protein [Planctomyces sp.]
MMKYVRTTRQTTQGSKFEGFSILEVVIVIAVISLLLALVVPAIQSARDSARRIDCSNRMHQIGLAVQLFESAHRAFPSSDPDCDDQPFRAKFRGLKSWQFQLLPYLDQVAVYEKLEEANTIRRVDRHLMFQLPILHCPAETVAIGMNYRFCAGRNCSDTSYHNSQQLTRGFGISAYTGSCRGKKISDITDGLSNTILMSERTLSEENTGHFNRFRDMWFSGAIELGFDPFSRTADDAANSCAAAEDTTKFYFPYVGHNLITYGLFNWFFTGFSG